MERLCIPVHAYSFVYPPMCSRKKQPKNFSSQNFMKSGTPMFLNVPNAMETSVFDGLDFLFLAAYVQPVCTRKPQLGQFLNRILGALCTRAAHVQPKMHPVSLIFRESHRLAASLQPIGCSVHPIGCKVQPFGCIVQPFK